jgi:hypothetical protein
MVIYFIIRDFLKIGLGKDYHLMWERKKTQEENSGSTYHPLEYIT